MILACALCAREDARMTRGKETTPRAIAHKDLGAYVCEGWAGYIIGA
jgi:hypothetical protein